MKNVILIYFMCAFSNLMAHAEQRENTLEVWSRYYQRGDTSMHSPLAISAILKKKKGEPVLVFRVVNVSKRPQVLYPYQLPWGNIDSIKVAAFTTNGKRIQNHYPIDDPVPGEKITIGPGQSMEGEYDLNHRLMDIPSNSDVVVMWLYRYFEGENKAPAIESGVVVIPKSK